jgi:hypothetical protein
MVAWYKKRCKKIVKIKLDAINFFGTNMSYRSQWRAEQPTLAVWIRRSSVVIIGHETMKPGHNKILTFHQNFVVA